MSAIANLVAYDGASTPVIHTLVPVSVTRKDSDITAEWREMVASVPAYAQVTCSLRLQATKSGLWKSETRVVVPTMEAVTNQNAAGYTAAPKVAFTDTFVLTGFHHPRSTITGRRLARQLIVNIANGVLTSVAAVTTGPVPELADQLVAPT
jgi:hypothetical protein